VKCMLLTIMFVKSEQRDLPFHHTVNSTLTHTDWANRLNLCAQYHSPPFALLAWVWQWTAGCWPSTESGIQICLMLVVSRINYRCVNKMSVPPFHKQDSLLITLNMLILRQQFVLPALHLQDRKLSEYLATAEHFRKWIYCRTRPRI
jgi:hypothetical protein